MALTDRLTLPKKLIAAGAGLALLFNVNCAACGQSSLPSKVQETLNHIARTDYGDAYQSSAEGPLRDKKGVVIGNFSIYDQGEKKVGSEVHIYSVKTQVNGKLHQYQATIDLRRHKLVSVK